MSLGSWQRSWAEARLHAQQWLAWNVIAGAVACLVGAAAVGIMIGPRGREHFLDYTWAAFTAGHPIFWDWSNYTLDGRPVRMVDTHAYEWLRVNVYGGRTWDSLFTSFARWGFLGWLATIVGLWSRFRGPGATEGKGRPLRGTVVVEPAEFMRRARQGAGPEGLGLRLGSVAIPRAGEAGHVLITGSTGAGKSTIIRQVLHQLEERGAPVLVFDPEFELTREFYRAVRGDLIMNPLDDRAPPWLIRDEVASPPGADLANLAAALLTAPRHLTPQDAFWLESGRQVLRDLIPLVEVDPQELARLLVLPADELHRTLKGTPSATILDPKAPAMGAGVMAGLAKVAEALRLLPPAGPLAWSARRWCETRSGWLFFTAGAGQREATLLLVSAWLTLLIHRLLDTPIEDAAARECWFVLDEVHALRRLDSLEALLVMGRKHGLRVVVGTQSVAQLRERYGHDPAITMLSLPMTTILLRTVDVETAKWAADRIGTQEREVSADSVAVGTVKHWRDSLQVSDRRTTDHAVLASEVMDLANLVGYLATAGLGVTRIEITYSPPDLSAGVPGFVPRDTATPSPAVPEVPDPGRLWGKA